MRQYHNLDDIGRLMCRFEITKSSSHVQEDLSGEMVTLHTILAGVYVYQQSFADGEKWMKLAIRDVVYCLDGEMPGETA